MHACMRARVHVRVRVYACKTRVRGEEIISSLERARESEGEGGGRGKEREREQTPVLRSAGMHPRGSASRPPAILFNPFLFSPRALHTPTTFRILCLSTILIAWKRAPIRESRRGERGYSETLDRISTWEKLGNLFSKTNFFPPLSRPELREYSRILDEKDSRK